MVTKTCFEKDRKEGTYQENAYIHSVLIKVRTALPIAKFSKVEKLFFQENSTRLA